MKFEWDEAKRRRTLETRGSNFADVAHLDRDTALIRDEYDWEGDEVRHVSIAQLRTDGRLYVVVWCTRGDTVRVISFRRAKPKEETLHERYGEER